MANAPAITLMSQSFADSGLVVGDVVKIPLKDNEGPVGSGFYKIVSVVHDSLTFEPMNEYTAEMAADLEQLLSELRLPFTIVTPMMLVGFSPKPKTPAFKIVGSGTFAQKP